MAPRPAAARTAVSVVSSTTEWKSFDQYTAEADLPPFELPVSETETLLFRCPSSDAMRDMAAAQADEDYFGIITAGFGDQAPRMWELGGPQPFPVLQKILADMMTHFGRSLESLGESSASSR